MRNSQMVLASWFAACLLSEPLLLATGAPSLLTTGAMPSRTALGESTAPLVSTDGRYIVFLSTAGNLVTNDRNRGLLDIFMKDLSTAAVSLISANTNAVGGNGRSYAPTISARGDTIAFVSEASDLVPNDTNGFPDIFLRDLESGTTRRISGAPDGRGADGPSSSPVLTPDGRFLFFASEASNMVNTPKTGKRDIYRADLGSRDLILASVLSPEFSNSDFADTSAFAVSENGNTVLFLSTAIEPSRFFGGSPNRAFARDLGTSVTTLLEFFTEECSPESIECFRPALSFNGGVGAVTTRLWTTNAISGGIFLADLSSGQNELLAPDLDTLFARRAPAIAGPILNRDGNTLFFQGVARHLPDMPEAVYAWNLHTRTATLLSTNTVRVAASQDPQPFGILAGASSNGRFAAWLSYSRPEVPHPSNEPLQLFVQDTLTGETRLITRSISGGASQASAEFPAVAFSAEGEILAFQSSAPDLIEDDQNPANDVFVYDWRTDKLLLVSHHVPTLPSASHPGLYLVGANSLSADGRFLAFISSTSLSAFPQLEGIPNVFVHDLVMGTNHLVSVAADGVTPANGSCSEAVLSADGKWVAYTSLASNLADGDTNMVADVFLTEVATKRTLLVSRAESGYSGNGASREPTLMPGGSRLAFVSVASDLDMTDTNRVGDLFVFERSASRLRMVGLQGFREPWGAEFTPDGAWLVFQSAGLRLNAWNVEERYLRSVSTTTLRQGTPVIISKDSSTVTFSGGRPDGTNYLFQHNFVANQTLRFEQDAIAWSVNMDGSLIACRVAGETGPDQILLVNRADVTHKVVSIADGSSALANGHCFSPAITPDGRFIIYGSFASNLASDDDNTTADLFLYDVQGGTTMLLTRNPSDGSVGDGCSAPPIIGRDGRTVVFISYASNLGAADHNLQADLFVLRLPGAESNFTISTLFQLRTGQITLLWPVRSGAAYQLEYTHALPDGWNPLNVPIVYADNRASAIDSSTQGPAVRFYRVTEIMRP